MLICSPKIVLEICNFMFVLICTDFNNMHDSISACGVGCKACTRKDASSECTECNDGFRRKATADKDCDRKSYFLRCQYQRGSL